MNLDEVLARLGTLPPEAQAKIKKEVLEATKGLCWIPNPGPQTEAYLTLADLLLYGGQGGGGKTDLLAGTALTQHKRSLLIRRQYTDLGALVDRTLGLYGSRKGFNGQPPASLRTTDGRFIEFGAAGSLEQVQTWQGQPHDFRGIDEACQLLEIVVRFLLGWVRDAVDELGVASTQRCRTILASNPPLSSEGEWIIGMFRPWLDLTHTNPAKHGELRWFITAPDGSDVEVAGPDDIREFTSKSGEKKQYIPKSRTFIPAALKDNPFLNTTGYQATLDAMPEPMRSAIRDGNFMAMREDDARQAIPTAWILAAQNRWSAAPPKHAPMCALSADIAQGGGNKTVLSARHDGWFAPLISVPGNETPLGSDVAALIIKHRRNNAVVVLDMGGGYGLGAFEHMKDNKIDCLSFMGGKASGERTVDRLLGFKNLRAQAVWRLREALDPDQPGGSSIALPKDGEMMADLASYRVKGDPTAGGILLEEKAEQSKRLGRSPDKGDAVVMAWWAGPTHVTHGRIWREVTSQATPEVHRGYQLRKGKRHG